MGRGGGRGGGGAREGGGFQPAPAVPLGALRKTHPLGRFPAPKKHPLGRFPAPKKHPLGRSASRRLLPRCQSAEPTSQPPSAATGSPKPAFGDISSASSPPRPAGRGGGKPNRRPPADRCARPGLICVDKRRFHKALLVTLPVGALDPALSCVENAELETDKRRLHKALLVALPIGARDPALWRDPIGDPPFGEAQSPSLPLSLAPPPIGASPIGRSVRETRPAHTQPPPPNGPRPAHARDESLWCGGGPWAGRATRARRRGRRWPVPAALAGQRRRRPPVHARGRVCVCVCVCVCARACVFREREQ